MSGPKLVGIICDPVVIARNNERLKAVGKEIYFRDLYKDINMDITNEGGWINNYAASTISRVPEDYGDPSGIISEIKELKREHILKAESEKINLSVIRRMSVEQLNELGVRKVKDIPKWKQDFIKEASVLLKKLQKDIEYYYSEERARKLASEEFDKQIIEGKSQSDAIVKELRKVSVTETDMERYEVGEMFLAPEVEEKIDSDTLPYSLDELALLEMFDNDIKEFEKRPYLTEKENEILASLHRNMKIAEENNKDYPMKSKRSVMKLIQMDYQRISKAVANLTAAHNAEQQIRSTLVIEYTSFIKALGRSTGNYQTWSIDVLQEKVRVLREEVEKQEERIYVEESIEEIMKKYGYSGISSYNLHDADKRSNIIFEDAMSQKISASFGDGMVMLHVVGEGSHPPTTLETEEQLRQQTAFCTMYPKIREELKKRGIHVETEDLEPVSEKHVLNIEIQRQKNIKKSTKRFSFRHVDLLSSDNDFSLQYDGTTSPKAQYVNTEG